MKTAIQKIETDVCELYSRLWPDIKDYRNPETLTQFLYNVDLPAGWFQDKKTLDVGCGQGAVLWSLKQLGAAPTGCDLGLETLEIAKLHLAGSGITLFQASVLELPFEAASFDFVHCNGVLHHTLDPLKGFKELVRMTRPGGTLFVGLYGKGGIYGGCVFLGRLISRIIPLKVMDSLTKALFRGLKLPNSFLTPRISIMDNLYVPIRKSYTEKEIRRWFLEAGFKPDTVTRTKNTLYDHRRFINRLIHGQGYIQFRGIKS